MLLPMPSGSFTENQRVLRCADVFPLKLASVYADALYVRKTTEDLEWVLWSSIGYSALGFVIELRQVMRKLVASSVPCRCNPQRTILHSMFSIYTFLVRAGLFELHCCRRSNLDILQSK